eukprot:Skav234811  [mRNA]  locus=scaffold69:721811:735898:- [translate_table: standard]
MLRSDQRAEEWSVLFPCFHKSVILITDHEDDYTRGCLASFVLNRPTQRSETYGRLEFNVWYGGPSGSNIEAAEILRSPLSANSQRQFCLHTRPLPGSDLVAPGIYMTEPWAASRSIMEGKAQVDDFMLLVGDCMWGPGQLQGELDELCPWAAASVTGPFASRLGSLMPPCKPMEPNFVDEPLPEMPAARGRDAPSEATTALRLMSFF